MAGSLKLVIAANRDEFFHRPAKDANFWDEDPNVIGGRDMTEGVSGGTWLAMSKYGHVAMLTNIRRDFSFMSDDQTKKGRGSLISDFVLGSQEMTSPREYMAKIEPERMFYKPFNLICGSVTNDEFYYSTSVDEAPPTKLDKETVCMSNGTLDCGWFKVEKSREKFQRVIDNFAGEEPSDLIDQLLKLLEDEERNFPDPNVKVENPYNEQLSSIFIPMLLEGHNYGTRTNTVIVVDEKNRVWFCERTMTSVNDPTDKWKKNTFQFDLINKEQSSKIWWERTILKD